jgi:TRAP-type C4-dicarboxylate transport system substrate-binding protein
VRRARLGVALLALAALALTSTGARANEGAPAPVVLRMAAIAPDGTAWAREMKAMSREIEELSGGRIHMKWIFGSIAGDELTALQRVKAGQLDGEAGALFCTKVAPSLLVTRIPGLFRRGSEGIAVVARLRSTIEAEARANGFVALAEGGFGIDVLFTRKPVRTMEELRATRLWVWSLDTIWSPMLKELGGKPVPVDVPDAARAYDDARLDGFIAVPSAALAYQWSTQTRYFTPLPMAFLAGCVVMSNRSFDALSHADQQLLKSTTARFMARFNDLGRLHEEQLLGGLLERQGLTKVPATDALVESWTREAAAARARLGEKLVPAPLLEKVLGWLDEMRKAGDR